ncbi:MAG: hypothetical protein R3E13_11750 [Alphaproteobacteria bacterium]
MHRVLTSRRHFKLTLLSGLFLGALSAPVYAANPPEPELYFYPAQGWSIAQDRGSCSISSRFNNSFVLGFSGDDQWIGGMSLDLQQDILEAGKSYDVTFTIPGLQSKTFKASGKSASLLGVDLRKQKEFYKALRESAVLDMNMEGNNFRFYLTGFANSAANFERCMAGAVIENPENKAAKMLTARSEEESFTLNESIAMEDAARAKTAAVVEILPENPAPVIQEIPVRETVKVGGHVVPGEERSAAQNDGAILDTNVQDLLDQPATQDPQATGRKRLSEQLAEQIAQNPSLIDVEGRSAPEPLQARKALEMPPGMEGMPLVPDYDSGAGASQAAQTQTAAVEDFAAVDAEAEPPAEALLAPLEKDNAAVEPTSVAPAETAVVAEPEPEPETIRTSSPPVKVHRQVTRAEADFTALEPAGPGPGVQELRRQVLDLEDMVEALKNENRALNDELSSALKESEDERMSIASENWNLERATMKFNEAERQIKRLGRQLQQERAKHNAEKRELEAMLFDPQVTDQAQLARLAALEEKLMKAERELEKYRGRGAAE